MPFLARHKGTGEVVTVYSVITHITNNFNHLPYFLVAVVGDDGLMKFKEVAMYEFVPTDYTAPGEITRTHIEEGV